MQGNVGWRREHRLRRFQNLSVSGSSSLEEIMFGKSVSG